MLFFRKGLAIGMTCFFMFMILLNTNVVNAQDTLSMIIVKATPDSTYASKQPLPSHLQKIISRSSARSTTSKMPITDTYLSISGKTYLVDRFGRIYDEANRSVLDLDAKSKKQLQTEAAQLRSQHYGQIIPWNTAKSELPRKSTFKVIDLESGKSFQVQRRAGSHHADVQPLTKADTAIMKQIYNGKWSWRRKAIIVQSDTGRFAASMAGMPHGGDGIPGNGFSGHFCIHFLGSTTHGSGNIDPEHQLMVLKAGGELDRFFNQADPYDMVNAYFIALDHKDVHLLNMSLFNASPQLAEYSSRMLQQISGVKPKLFEPKQNVAGLLAVDLPVQVQILRRDQSNGQVKWNFHLRRMSLLDPWSIDSLDLIQDKKTRPPRP